MATFKTFIMISITGTSGGKVYNDTLVDVETAAKIVGSPIDFRSTEKLIFKVVKERTKKDPGNRMERYQLQRSMAPVVSGTTQEGEYIEVRYFKTKNGTGKDVKYLPARIYHKGMEMKVDVQKDKELAFFLSICGMCKDSPIARGKGGKHFFIDDKLKNAKETLRQESRIAQLITTIHAMPDSQVKRVAHALKLSGVTANGKRVSRSVSGIGVEPIDAIRAQLISIAKDLPQQFEDMLGDQDTLLKGAIREAKVEGVIIQRTLGKGIVAWNWRKNIEDGSEICRSRSGQDPYVALFQHVTSKPENFEFFNATVNDAMGYDNLIQEVSTEPNTPIAIVLDAIKKNSIYFDRAEQKVFKLFSNGEIDGHSIHNVKDIINWQQELAEAIVVAPVKKARVLAAPKDKSAVVNE